MFVGLGVCLGFLVLFGFLKISSILEVKRNPSPEKEANKHKVVIERGDSCGSGSAFAYGPKNLLFFIK